MTSIALAWCAAIAIVIALFLVGTTKMACDVVDYPMRDGVQRYAEVCKGD